MINRHQTSKVVGNSEAICNSVVCENILIWCQKVPEERLKYDKRFLLSYLSAKTQNFENGSDKNRVR